MNGRCSLCIVLSSNHNVAYYTPSLRRRAQATVDGSSFYWAGTGTGSGAGTFTVGWASWSYSGDATTFPAVTVFLAQGAKFVDINPFDNALYATAQTPT